MLHRLSTLVFFLLVNHTLFAQHIIHSEMLGRPTDHGITVQLIFDDSVAVRIQYGTISGQYTNQTSWTTFADSVPAEINITGLLPNTQYFYRVNYRRSGTTTVMLRPEYKFHTARPQTDRFTFVIQADPHMDNQTDTAIYNRCLQNQLEDNPDFMIDLGDVIMTDKLRDSSGRVSEDTILSRTRLMRSYYEKMAHSVPVYMTLGNHEGEAGWNLNGTASNIAVWDTKARQKYLLNPIPNTFYTGDTVNHPFVGQRENYYAWQWGDALFIVLDPYWYTPVKPDSLNGWRWTLGRTQYEWLRTTLQSSTAHYKFVFSHQLVGGDPDGRGGVEFANLYEWGGDNLNGTPGFSSQRPGWYKPIKDVLTENRVTAFFHGHDHFFGKQDKDCIVYQEVPQPGHPNFSSTQLAVDYGYTQGIILPSAGHLRITVDTAGVLVEYVRAYKASDESPTRHNKDVSASYQIARFNCFDSISFPTPILWNANYTNEIVYPNPFVSYANIEFTLNQPETITMDIFDVNARLIRHLVPPQRISAGSFRITWDGTDDQNNRLSSGTYFYRITDEHGAIRTGRILLQNP